MPTQNTSVDCWSPLIQYQPDGAWHKGDDDRTNQYRSGTFIVTDRSGATATFNFTGTSIRVVGAYRGNHGPFTAQIDGKEYDPWPFGDDNPPERFQQDIFRETSLPMGNHTLVLTAQEGFFDIDYISWGTDVDISSARHYQSSVFTGEPEGAWQNRQDARYDNGDERRSTQNDATMTIPFEGSYVEVYGTVGDDASPYTVQLDDGEVTQFNGHRRGWGSAPKALLYHANNLGSSGPHNLVLQAKPDGEKQGLNVDWVYLDSSVNHFATGNNSDSGLSTGSIAGIAVSCVLSVALAVLLALYLRRRRKIKGRVLVSVDTSPELESPQHVRDQRFPAHGHASIVQPYMLGLPTSPTSGHSSSGQSGWPTSEKSDPSNAGRPSSAQSAWTSEETHSESYEMSSPEPPRYFV